MVEEKEDCPSIKNLIRDMWNRKNFGQKPRNRDALRIIFDDFSKKIKELEEIVAISRMYEEFVENLVKDNDILRLKNRIYKKNDQIGYLMIDPRIPLETTREAMIQKVKGEISLLELDLSEIDELEEAENS